ncbi:MAG: T9SS type A sorting domain-containing protein [Candidatus Woesebacteria bacterium]|nr:T9SS type A sorting domain-containing protein [Candidatus Woesebacteria bacterium]
MYAQSVNYYVSTSGNNANAGTSIALAWQTVQRALDSATPGSTVYILSGTYNEKTTLGVSGTLSNPITFRNYNSDVVIIDGTGITLQDEILDISNKSFVTFQGLIFQNSIGNDSKGIFVQGICSNLVFKGNTIRQIYFSSNPSDPVSSSTNASPFLFWGTDATTPITNSMIDSNFIYNCRTGYSEAFTLEGNVDTFTVKNNIVHDITNIGIDLAGNYAVCPNPANDQARNGVIKWNKTYNCISSYATSGGIYVDGGRDLIIENNISYHNGWGIEIGCEVLGKTSSNITVRNNLLYNNIESGFAFGGYDYPATSGKILNCNFSGNTIFSNDSTNSTDGEVFISYSENCSFQNNIVYTSANNWAFTQNGTVPLNLTSDYNLFYSPAGTANISFLYAGSNYTGFSSYKTGTDKDFNSSFENPIFVTTALPNPDLHITTTSPANNAGNPSFIAGSGEVDMDNQIRVYNGRVDIGADEFGSTPASVERLSIDLPTHFSLDQNYPNPFNPTTTISFSLPSKSFVSLKVFDDLGREVSTVLSEVLSAGNYTRQWNASDLTSGIYFYRLQAGSFTETKKLVLLR